MGEKNDVLGDYLCNTEDICSIATANTDIYSIATKMLSTNVDNIYKINYYDRIFVLQPKIKNVIFNDPATIVYWEDRTKTVVKCEKEKYDPEKGLAMAIAKKAMGNQGNYFEVFKKWIGEDKLFPEKKKEKKQAPKKKSSKK